jgi:hypothetical protein
MYVDCFMRIYARVGVQSNKLVDLIPAPVAVWNVESGDWLEYQAAIWEGLAALAGGVAIHTYTHGASPQLITSSQMMDAPYQSRYYQFRAYRDFMVRVPLPMRSLPVYITETDQNDPWVDANTGWVQEAYAEINRWNQTAPNGHPTQKIHCLALYRWPNHDRWHIEGKQGVIDDFHAAIAQGYQSPTVTSQKTAQKYSDQSETTYMPSVSNGSTSQPTPPLPPRDIDPRATQRGVTIDDAAVSPGTRFWHAGTVRWFSEPEAGGRHHIYVEALDEYGSLIAGAPFRVEWADTEHDDVTKGGTGFEAGNYPMSPSRNDFSVHMLGEPSDVVKGIGMGEDTPSGFNPGAHTSTLVTFQRMTMPAVAKPAPQQPAPCQPAQVPPLAHPIADPALRVISQQFGARDMDYSGFGMAGHNGVDLACPMDTPVRAVDDGVVAESMIDEGGYGKYVKIRHVWGESLYAHLDAALVSSGDSVQSGQYVGTSGNSGNSTGPHLHFGIRIDPYTRGYPYDGYSDPLPYLNAAPGQPSKQPSGPMDLLPLIKSAAAEFGIEWQLLASLVWAESSWRADAKSNAGAMGLAQLMPDTWDEWSATVGGTDPYNPSQNLRVGAAYLANLLRYYRGDVGRAVLAYNMGPGNVDNGVIPPEATALYVVKVVFGYDLLGAVTAYMSA